MPPGFNEACYGGDFSKNLTGAKPVYSAKLDLDHSSRPILSKLLASVGGRHQMKVFDEGARFKESDLFMIYLCSEKGIFSYVDSRAAGSNSVRIDVFSYRESSPTVSFISDLDSALLAQWPDGLKKNGPTNTSLRNSILWLVKRMPNKPLHAIAPKDGAPHERQR
jgi:hypothetical protein